jgi:hypothetical protein
MLPSDEISLGDSGLFSDGLEGLSMKNLNDERHTLRMIYFFS